MRKRKVFRETVITVIVIAVITLDALKQCIKVEDKIHKSPNESSTNHRIKNNRLQKTSQLHNFVLLM